MVDNEAYRTYCRDHEPDLPLFHQAWWWDAVAGKNRWQGLVSKSLYQEKAAILPFIRTRKWGFSTIRKPIFTTYTGPLWADEASLSLEDRATMQQLLWPDLLGKLPRIAYLKMMLRPEVGTLPMSLHADFKVSTRTTYTIDLTPSPSEIVDSFNKEVRRKLRKFTAGHHVAEADRIDDFLPLVQAVYARQKMAVPYPIAQLRTIFTTARQHEATKLLLLRNAQNENVGGLLLGYDRRKVYLLVSAVSEEGRRVAAVPQLLRHAIDHFQPTHRTFDFCGSMLPRIAVRNRGLGGVREEYGQIEQCTGILKFLAYGR